MAPELRERRPNAATVAIATRTYKFRDGLSLREGAIRSPDGFARSKGRLLQYEPSSDEGMFAARRETGLSTSNAGFRPPVRVRFERN